MDQEYLIKYEATGLDNENAVPVYQNTKIYR